MAGPLTKAGRYQIVSELGRGSMGVVYQGFDPVIGRTVAVKTMLTEGLTPAEFEDFKARFQREAQSAGVLTHPNIVTVYDFGEDEGILYLAMEFLEGKSLQDLVEAQGVLAVETIVPMYEQVCSALDHAHAHKIIHRDIKPANIMILDSGLVKVTDFGIAKMMSTGMTQAGQILGTPNYMSPEQVKGRQIDGRSDIFALGVVLYELVTGEKPFGGQNITTVIYKIINENPIPPRELDATIHPGLSYVIQKALAKNPEERYQTCRELADDLKNYKQLGGMQAPSATVIVRVPPVGASVAETPIAPPAQPAPARYVPEYPPSRPLSVQVIPPSKPRAPGTSPVVWVLLTLLVVGALGGGYYFVLRKPEAANIAQNAPPAVTPQSQPASPPASPPTEAAAPPQGAAGTESAAGTPAAGAAGTTPGAASAPGMTPAANPQPAESAEPRAPAAEPRHPAENVARPAAPKTGRLLVTATVEGARISLDGKSDPAWVTPYTIPDVPAGTHSVVVSKTGYSNYQQSVTIEGGRTNSLNAPLSVPSGEINISTVPPGIEVWIDGQSAGLSPVQKTVGLGQHTYALRVQGKELYSRPFEIKSDGVILNRNVDLSGSIANASMGIVEVRTIPPGATVSAEGKAVGGTTPTSFRLTAGRHTLTISLSGYAPLRKEVDVPDGSSIAVNEKLSPQ
jgi:serine/threonine protein kinase